MSEDLVDDASDEPDLSCVLLRDGVDDVVELGECLLVLLHLEQTKHCVE